MAHASTDLGIDALPRLTMEALESFVGACLIGMIMAHQDDFELWLGRIRGSAGDRLTNRIIRSANLSGGIRRAGARAKSRFTGSRIGRGSGVGRLLASGGDRGRYSRRVVVKASIVRLGSKGLARASAHLRYLQRDGTTREGERCALYSEREDVANGKAFVERGSGDLHQFRFIVAPEDASLYDDLKPLVRRLMQQVEKDLGTKLDWVAVDHFNTGHPHSHILVRGKDERRADLVIAREYISRGLRERAVELVNLDLGPRTELEIQRSQLREVDQERFTGLDRRLTASADEEGVVDPRHRSRSERDLRLARLRRLEQMGLASEQSGGCWRLAPELEPALRRIGTRGDIIRTMNRELALANAPRLPQDHAIYDPAVTTEPLIGRLVTQGLSDEHADRRFVILDGIDGRTHYVDIGGAEMDAGKGAILSVSPRTAEPRELDRTIAAVAAASGSVYSPELHLDHDPEATEAFTRAHVRRLEALRRAGVGVSREPDGSWAIAPDHLERVEAHERKIRARLPVAIALLSDRPLELLQSHDGATWLDRELTAETPVKLARGFGVEVAEALERRLQWLAEQKLIDLDADSYRFKPGAIEELERRDFRRAATMLAKSTGKAFIEPEIGEQVQGICRGPAQVGDRKFGLVERAHEFSLVPWRPMLERRIGREISGIVRASGISWTFGREREGPSIGM